MSSYIDHRSRGNGEIIHSWADQALKRLCWIYSDDRAWMIRLGRDPATQRDLEAWNRLGRKDAA